MGNDGKGKVKVRHLTKLQRLFLHLLHMPVSLYYASLRYTADSDNFDAITNSSRPTVIVIWHNRILTSPGIKRKYLRKNRIFAAISTSRDGAWISEFVDMLGIESCRGSSSKRGAQMAREMIGELRAGHDIAVTPDGPRGPLYTFHEGAAALALMAHAPVTIICPIVKNGMRFNSWDGFYLPWPFSKIEIRSKRFEPDSLPRDRTACTVFLRDEMLKLTEDLPESPRTRASRERAAAKMSAKSSNPPS